MTLMLVGFAAQPALANCSDPVGIRGEQVYNGTHEVMQFCNGDDWISMSGNGSDNLGNHTATEGVIFASKAGDLPIGSGSGSGSEEGEEPIPVEPEDCTLPWGGTLADGDNVTAYEYADQSCSSTETRTCSGGTLSGAYIYQSCSIPGQVAFTSAGVHSWTVPAGVTSISVVAVGAGGLGARSANYNDGNQAGGGGGGALAYKNNILVTPGETIMVNVGLRPEPTASGDMNGQNGGDSVFGDVFSAGGGKGGTLASLALGGLGGCPSVESDGGSCGGRGGNANGSDNRFGGGGGGAGGYTGAGGRGGESASDYIGAGEPGTGGAGGGGNGGAYRGGGGGGVGLMGAGVSGNGGTGGINDATTGGKGGSSGTNGNQSGGHYSGHGGNYGGGSAGQNYTSGSSWQGTGGHGAVRIIWPGNVRQFPSTRAVNE